MLTKYTLVNVPIGGVCHLIDSRRFVINDQLTDADADILINAGHGNYFRPIPEEDNGKNKKNSAQSGVSKTAKADEPGN